MMSSRKMRFVAGALGALVVIGAGTGVALGAGGQRTRWVSVEEAWILDSVEESEVAVNPDGTPLTEDELPAPGSMFFFRDEIYAAAGAGTAKGARIGTSYGQCSVGTDGALCDVHASLLPRGTVELSFSFAFADIDAPQTTRLPVAVLGGTGEFAGISGELVVDETDPDASRAELDATVPELDAPRRR